MADDDPGTPLRCRVTVAGPVPAAVLGAVRARFDLLAAEDFGPDGVLVVDRVDQAAQRALLTLLWDAGLVVRTVTSTGG